MRIELDATVERARVEITALRTGISEERQARQAQVRELDERFSEFAVGGYDKEWIGFAWLLIATVLTAC